MVGKQTSCVLKRPYRQKTISDFSHFTMLKTAGRVLCSRCQASGFDKHVSRSTKMLSIAATLVLEVVFYTQVWPSIKPGTWNIPEHAGTFRNIPEHRIIIIIMRNICKIRVFLTELRRGGIGSVGIHSAFHNECRLFFFPANCVTWLYSVVQSHTQKMDETVR